MQGLLVGALVTVGFLGFFALVGLPVSYGVGAIARAIPWAGLATGAALANGAAAATSNERLALSSVTASHKKAQRAVTVTRCQSKH